MMFMFEFGILLTFLGGDLCLCSPRGVALVGSLDLFGYFVRFVFLVRDCCLAVIVVLVLIFGCLRCGLRVSLVGFLVCRFAL